MEQNKLWFRAKRYGWGWVPCSWQGWSVLVMYLFALLANAKSLSLYIHSGSEFFTDFFPETYVLTVFLIIICYATGEKPKWRWGKSDADPKNQN